MSGAAYAATHPATTRARDMSAAAYEATFPAAAPPHDMSAAIRSARSADGSEKTPAKRAG